MKMNTPQIDKMTDLFRSVLRKHNEDFDLITIQRRVIESSEFPSKLLKLMYEITEPGNLISRTVDVNRSRSPRKMLEATGYQVEDSSDHVFRNRPSILPNLPKGFGKRVQVVFIKLDYSHRDYDFLEKECAKRGLILADPYSLAAVHEQDKTFQTAKTPRWNFTCWKGDNGMTYAVEFRSFCDGKNKRCSVVEMDFAMVSCPLIACLRKSDLRSE